MTANEVRVVGRGPGRGLVWSAGVEIGEVNQNAAGWEAWLYTPQGTVLLRRGYRNRRDAVRTITTVWEQRQEEVTDRG